MLRKSKAIVTMSSLALVGLMNNVQAQDKQLSLKALLDLSSSVSSKVEQPIQDAPGFISVYTQADIRRLGYYTIADLADVTSGYSSYTLYGERTLVTEGQKASSWNNNKHLVLIDGIPVNNLEGNAPDDDQLPLAFAKRVEFLKGPASALYGTGAFLGVVNVVSQEPTENGASSDFMLTEGGRTNQDNGHAGLMYRALANSYYKSDDGISKVNFGYTSQDANDLPIGLAPNDTSFRNNNDQKSIFLNASHQITSGYLQGLGVGVIYMSKDGGGGDYWLDWAPNVYYAGNLTRQAWTEFIPYIKYNRELMTGLSVNAYAKFNESHEIGAYLPTWGFGDATNPSTWTSASSDSNMASKTMYSMYDKKMEGYEALGEVHYQFLPDWNLIAGVNFDTRSYLGGNDGSYSNDIQWVNGQWAPVLHEPGFDQQLPAVTFLAEYAQVTGKLDYLLDGTLLTAGVREDEGFYVHKTYTQLSPRVAVVQKLTPDLSIKVLYGTALRSPGIKEEQSAEEGQNVWATAQAAGATLIDKFPTPSPETVGDFESGVAYSNGQVYGSISYFHEVTGNPLNGVGVRYRTSAGDTLTFNALGNSSGKTTSDGVELDAQYVLTKDIRFFGNYSYAWARSSTNSGDSIEVIADAPTQTANLGAFATFDVGVPLNLSLVGKWIGPTFTGAKRQTTSSESSMPIIIGDYNGTLWQTKEGWFTADVKVGVGISKNLTLEVAVLNLANAQAYYYLGGVPNAPINDRTIDVSLTSTF